VSTELPKELTMVKQVTQRDIDCYAEASGDFNPIHVDAEYAAKTPFGGTVVHGMLVLAYVSELMTNSFGKQWLSGGTLRLRFKGPARPGDALTINAGLQDDHIAGEKRTIYYAVSCQNGRGEMVVEGQAQVVFTIPV